jgi:catechol 2,3-dioxygenase-like lactoylglutathione lyase family enzyme
MAAHFILYVADQAAATAFWAAALDRPPRLDVPGMTELDLGGDAVLGLMPEAGIGRLLGVDAAAGRAGPRAELYLHVSDPAAAHARALAAGAVELSPVQLRDWGEEAGYVRCPDGHVLAFARAR